MEDKKTYVFIDIETNIPSDSDFKALGQLACTEIKCVVFKLSEDTPSKGPTWTYVCDKQKDLVYNMHYLHLNMESEGRKLVFVGHNIIRFDIPVLERVWGFNLRKYGEVEDTLLMSKILYPERMKHSLESWMADLMLPPKRSLDDLVARCMDDVIATEQVFNTLRCARGSMSLDPFRLEYKVAEIITEQCIAGMPFDKHKAEELVKEIDEKLNAIRAEALCYSIVIPASKLDFPPKKQFKKNGEPSVAIINYAAKYGCTITPLTGLSGTSWAAMDPLGRILEHLPTSSPFKISESLDIDSTDSVKTFLYEQGWEPEEWNTNSEGVRTSPKLFTLDKELCPSVERLAYKAPFVKKLSEFFSLRNRRNVLKSEKSDTGWLNNPRLRVDGKLTPDADTIGAVTGRFTHRIVANVPRVSTLLGKEFRSLFDCIVCNGNRYVGWDASALEACMEAHYTFPYDDGAYAKLLQEGDVHTFNQMALGLATRDDAKKFKYMITYGAGIPKIARTFNVSRGKADAMYEGFWAANPALQKLKAQIEKTVKERGFIYAIDGRKIPVDSSHLGLNRLLQSAGAITMKYAMVIADRLIKKEGLAARGVIRYHDEEQWISDEACADRVGKLGVQSIELAGKYLKLKVPLKGEYKVGNNWSETH